MFSIKTLSISLFTTTSIIFAQNAAVSLHINFGGNVTGDISICEVRIPSEGVALNTFYETLGFWGNKSNSTGNDYGGIQKSNDSRGSDIHIFSIWHVLDDPNDTANFPYAVYLGHGSTSEHFGGEGVGLKTWIFELGWEPDVWYTHLVKTWDSGDETCYGFFVCDGVSQVWRHLSTVALKEPNLRIKGANDVFIEDWWGTGDKVRETNLRNSWRRDNNGAWHCAQSGQY